ncbi:MAG: hypothetical protein JXM79_24200 [Sedimentisphaerales bacterium]|nr:hypothetical protein [Sedimentisphaerales bacterium]
MFERIRKSAVVSILLIGFIILVGSAVQANWFETFDGNAFDLSTWQFHSYPDLTNSFSGAIQDGPDDNDYLLLNETSTSAIGGSQFGIGFGSEEVFTDVRVGAVVNVTGNLRNYHGLAARVSHFIDDGSVSGAPGIIANTYLMLIHWQDGPANLRIEVFKTVNNLADIMKNYHEEPVPGLGHARSYYAELDVVGSNPVYITGSLYEYKDGPLLARTPVFIDTNGNDSWENEGVHDAVYTSGISAIFGMNQKSDPPGYSASFDEVFSVSDGPAAVNPSPAIGATDVPIDVTLSWIEADFATGRELWFGKAGAMEKVDPAPTGMAYTAGPLEFGQTYEWRVDQVGASGVVTGHTWTFTTADYLTIEDFESYGSDAGIQADWPHNIEGFDYIFLAADDEGDTSMRFYYQNQYEPFFTEATRTFESLQDWTRLGVEALSLSFAGQVDNVEQLMYLKVEDAVGNNATVEHPFRHACQSRRWFDWVIPLSEFSVSGVDLTQMSKLTIGFGDGATSGQADEDLDSIYIDDIRLYPAR